MPVCKSVPVVRADGGSSCSCTACKGQWSENHLMKPAGAVFRTVCRYKLDLHAVSHRHAGVLSKVHCCIWKAFSSEGQERKSTNV